MNLSKLLGILYIAAAAVFTVLGFTNNQFDFLYTFFVCSLTVVGAMVLFMKDGMKKSVYLSRILVGALFVVSGLIKANDPVGFSYKLEEYFEPNALGWSVFTPYALFIAMLVSIGEIILGFAILLGGKARLASWLLVGMILFFAWLTYYTATCDPQATYIEIVEGQEVEKSVNCVTDCGCFGDAMKDSIGRSLTPWESFYKDIILLVFVIIIFIQQKAIKLNTMKEDLFILPTSVVLIAAFAGGLFGWWFPAIFTVIAIVLALIAKKLIGDKFKEWAMALAVTLVASGFAVYCYQYLPVKDFRPYAVGKNLPGQMTIPEGAPIDVYEDVWYYKVNGVTSEYTTAQKPWEIEGAEFVDRVTTLVEKGYEPPIHDFSFEKPSSETPEALKQMLYSDSNFENLRVIGNRTHLSMEEWQKLEGDDISYMLEQVATVDYTDYFMNQPGYLFLLISKDAEHANTGNMEALSQLANEAMKEGHGFIGLSVGGEAVENFRHEHQLMFDFYSVDFTTLKTIVRSNPGLLLLKEGNVVGKWSHNSFPSYQEVKEAHLK